jgi:hypothetical protein
VRVKTCRELVRDAIPAGVVIVRIARTFPRCHEKQESPHRMAGAFSAARSNYDFRALCFLL